MTTTRVLFLCTGNSCRSQMAEGLLAAVGDDFFTLSAGVDPHGLNPLAVKAMAEIGLDISGQSSDHIDDYVDQSFGYVITVCDHVREACPVFPIGQQVYWSFDDPAQAGGTEEERMAVFRRIRDEIQRQLQEFASGLRDP